MRNPLAPVGHAVDATGDSTVQGVEDVPGNSWDAVTDTKDMVTDPNRHVAGIDVGGAEPEGRVRGRGE
jgi:hypothetical protein